MKTTIQNQLNMVSAVLAVLTKTNFKPVWENQMPTVFTKKVTKLTQAHAAALTLGKNQTQSTKGTTDEKNGAEARLEEILLRESGLLKSYYEDHNDALNLAKVSVPEGTVRNLPNQELLSLGILAGELAAAVRKENPATAEEYGLTEDSGQKLETATTTYKDQIGQPRGARAARKHTTQELKQAVEGLIRLLENMDNFIPAFGSAPGGAAFAGAWHNARVVIPLGHRFEKTGAPSVPEAAAPAH